MKRPQYVFRPNLSDPQHRRAWALLQQVPSAKRKEFLVQAILATEQTAEEKHPQGGAGGVAGSQQNQRCSKPTVRECYTRLCARFPEFTVGGDSNVLIIGRKAEGKRLTIKSQAPKQNFREKF